MAQDLDDVVEEVLDVFTDNGLDFNGGMNVLARCVARGLFIINGSSYQNDEFFDVFKKATLAYKATLTVNNVSIHDVAGHA